MNYRNKFITNKKNGAVNLEHVITITAEEGSEAGETSYVIEFQTLNTCDIYINWYFDTKEERDSVFNNILSKLD